MKLPRKWKVRNPFRARNNIKPYQLDQLRKAALPNLTILELTAMMKMYQGANECQRGHAEEMANLCKLTIAIAYLHSVGFALLDLPARWFLTIPTSIALAVCFAKMIKAHMWMVRDKDKHIDEFVGFFLDKLVRDTPGGEELTELLNKAFGSGTAQIEVEELPADIQQYLNKGEKHPMIIMEDFFKEKGGGPKDD